MFVVCKVKKEDVLLFDIKQIGSYIKFKLRFKNVKMFNKTILEWVDTDNELKKYYDINEDTNELTISNTYTVNQVEVNTKFLEIKCINNINYGYSFNSLTDIENGNGEIKNIVDFFNFFNVYNSNFKYIIFSMYKENIFEDFFILSNHYFLMLNDDENNKLENMGQDDLMIFYSKYINSIEHFISDCDNSITYDDFCNNNGVYQGSFNDTYLKVIDYQGNTPYDFGYNNVMNNDDIILHNDYYNYLDSLNRDDLEPENRPTYDNLIEYFDGLFTGFRDKGIELAVTEKNNNQTQQLEVNHASNNTYCFYFIDGYLSEWSN
jgi:hypothetical protein